MATLFKPIVAGNVWGENMNFENRETVSHPKKYKKKDLLS